MAYLLGIDIGTSGTKTVLFNEHGNTVASAIGEYPFISLKSAGLSRTLRIGGKLLWILSGRYCQRAVSILPI